jgi:hypothetical protein
VEGAEVLRVILAVEPNAYDGVDVDDQEPKGADVAKRHHGLVESGEDWVQDEYSV